MGKLPEHSRAEAYVQYADWISATLTRAANEPMPKPPAFLATIDAAAVQGASLLGMTDEDLRREFATRELSNWSAPVYGSKEFVHSTMRKAGYKNLPAMKPPDD